MSYTQTIQASSSSRDHQHTVQQSDAKKKSSRKCVDPEHVKSPHPPAAGTTTSSKAGSFKASFGSKTGFLSLLLCCTAGAAGPLVDDDKSSIFKQQRRPPSIQQRKQPPHINTDPVLLTGNETPVTSNTPLSSPNQQLQQDEEGHLVRLLPPMDSEDEGRKCLVLDLDETLVHSSFKIIPNPDFIVPVEIENQYHNVYVLKRPGVDEFMRKMGEQYEVVVFTASLSKYADPVLDMLDIHKVVKHRLFREACCNYKGTYVKDLSQLGRDLSGAIILDNSPASYLFHNANAVPISTWFNDPHDTELSDLVDFLQDLSKVDDVTSILNTNLNNELSFSTR